MRWVGRAVWLLPVLLALLFCWQPPRGDDAYYHTVSAVEQVRAWEEGAVLPRWHRGWNGGTGSFAPTVYAPVPLAIQGALARLTDDGQRAVGLSLALAVAAAAAGLVLASRSRWVAVLMISPYLLAIALTRATTTEAWALAGAAAVLALGLPPGICHQCHGLGLAAAVALVSASQLGMLLQLAWILGVAWAVAAVVHIRGRLQQDGSFGSRVGRTLAWAAAGLLAAAVFWLPAVIDGSNLALGEALTGDLDWRGNFLPGGSSLSALFTAAAVGICVVVLMVVVRGSGPRRLPLAGAMIAGLLLTSAVSQPLWQLPGMAYLQFPWRFLGPATVVAVLALDCLAGRWRWLAAVILVLPSVLVPLRLDPDPVPVPSSASPSELARITAVKWGLPPILPSARGFYAPGFHRLASLQELESQPVSIGERARDAQGASWQVRTERSTEVLLPLQWWPEWRPTVNGEPRPFANRSGLVGVLCGAGTSEVRVQLGRSRSRTLGALVTLAGLLLVAALARIRNGIPTSGEMR